MAKHTILIVDDEVNILNSLGRLLRAEDYDVVTAENVAQGIEKLKEKSGVDLVISDNKMPDGTGVEFFIKVRQLYPDTIRILITGYPDLESAISAINKGQVYRFVTKPWNNEELKLIVKQALDYYDVIRDNRSLLTIAKQQSDMINAMQTKVPEIKKDFDKGVYILDEKKVSETLEEFMKKYYPDQLEK
ncbi:response regulator [bacterium]|nr:MAG: response regulator [bacterium]